MKRLLALLGVLLVAALLFPPSAEARRKKSEGVPVRVVVEDEDGNPIPTAVIRHPAEADRHRVNAVDGSWEASVLYLPDGSELVFQPGTTLELEISAPGYVTQVVHYDIRKRNNKMTVTLHPLELDSEEIEEPVMQFGRDRPREESTGSAPAN